MDVTMLFQWPFDEAQSQNAKREFSKLRSKLRAWRINYPPKDTGERYLFIGYEMCIRMFGEELLKPHDAINTDFMNRIKLKAAAFEFLFDRSINQN